MKGKNTKKRKGIDAATMRCPYCGSPVVYRTADGIYHDNKNNTMLYVCSNYPKCDAYVRANPQTNRPMGTLANGELRALRTKAHHYFDRLYKEGYMSRNDAYNWLADFMGVPHGEAHIGYWGEYYCNQVIERCKELIKHRKRAEKQYRRKVAL